MSTRAGFLLDDPSIWVSITIGGKYLHDGILPIQFSSPDQVSLLVILMRTDIFSNSLYKFQPIRLTGGFLEREGIIY